MKQFYTYIAIAILISIISCSESQNNKNENENLLNNIYGSDTLIIEARFADCGEWGGHKERFEIYRKNDNNLSVHYSRDTVNCPDPSYFNRRIVEEWSGKLSKEDQLTVIKFINELITMSFKDEGECNTANYYSITRRNKKLNMEYHNFTRDWKGFINFRNTLKNQ
jgi:hypothetical protein